MMLDSINAFKHTLNVLLGYIKPFNTVQCILYVPIVLLEGINMILAHYAGIICLPISYALNYAGIFDGRLVLKLF